LDYEEIDQDHLLARLLEEFRLAKLAYSEANDLFDSICRDTPNGLLYPDGRHRIQVASQELNIAHWRLIRATERLNQYTLDNQVPV
jgi:hypothetical protein